ncbi:aminotransferase class III-fold pyridoxal phosphate-dependent enzyme [Pirellulaceae bacterium SH449]
MSRRFRPLGTIRTHDPHQNLAWIRGQGGWLWDSEGNRFLDCVSGYSANVLGHCHPDLAAALTDQASRLSFATGGECALRSELEEQLCELAANSLRNSLQQRGTNDQGEIDPKGESFKAWVSTTGARAIEIAWRIAYQCRPGRLVTFDLGYHGRSIATSLISDTPQQAGLLDPRLSDEQLAIPFPRAITGDSLAWSDACDESLERFRAILQQRADELSALLVEPAIGSRGYYFAPSEYFQKLTVLAREFGMLVISDEIQMGLGRLGSLVASHGQGWHPDLLVLGKALGGGMIPVACVLGKASLMDSLGAGLESETFAASPLACRLGIETLKVLGSSDCIATSSELHESLRENLAGRIGRQAVVGAGSATVIDCRAAVAQLTDAMGVTSRLSSQQYSQQMLRNRTLATEIAYRFAGMLRENGILVHVTGSQRDRIAIIPPLNVGESEINLVADACQVAWEAIAAEWKSVSRSVLR